MTPAIPHSAIVPHLGAKTHVVVTLVCSVSPYQATLLLGPRCHLLPPSPPVSARLALSRHLPRAADAPTSIAQSQTRTSDEFTATVASVSRPAWECSYMWTRPNMTHIRIKAPSSSPSNRNSLRLFLCLQPRARRSLVLVLSFTRTSASPGCSLRLWLWAPP